MLKLNKVSRRFGTALAVNEISLDVPTGQMVVVIGRSGAGKSTLIRMINRLVEPTSGSILFGDTDVTRLRGRALRQWRGKAAMIFQGFNLSPRLDVLTNVLVGASLEVPQARRLFGLYTQSERLRAAEALDDLGLIEKALERAERLSGGQQQRAAIARALMQRPSLILADEPIASLDPHNARIVMDTLRRINRDQGITVLCNLHNIDTARAYADRIVGLNAGRIVFDGTPTALNDRAIADVYGGTFSGEDVPEMAA
ncbi:MAG: phosphonate ABC transporter ATP-binding protein [Kaistia sp. SCN 65-12]|nr:MAG: phosphonate ABC transporter ATP-binding protein [Kaistia sp. SCN 65-12]